MSHQAMCSFCFAFGVLSVQLQRQVIDTNGMHSFMGRQKFIRCNKIKVVITKTQERQIIQIKQKCGQKLGRPPQRRW